MIPEAAAILLLLLQRRGWQQRRSRWYWREWSSLALVVAAGAVALIGVAYLDRQEQTGHAWRAATVRNTRRIPVNETERLSTPVFATDYHGRITLDNESLYIVVRAGYRPHLTRRLLVVSIVVSAVLTVAVLVSAAVATWRRRPAPDRVVVEGGAEDAQPPPLCLCRGPRPWRDREAPPRGAQEGDPPGGGNCRCNGERCAVDWPMLMGVDISTRSAAHPRRAAPTGAPPLPSWRPPGAVAPCASDRGGGSGSIGTGGWP